MAETQYGRAGKHWFVGDGFIWDDQPAEYRAASGRPRECSSKLFVFNPQRTKARVRVRFYHVDRPPSEVGMTVEPSAIGALELAALPEVPHKQSFWIALQSNVPVLPQALHQDFTFWEEVPDAMVAVAPYPGPLQDETSWVFPDCYQGRDPSWHEIETLSILNPGNAEVSVRVRYFPRGRARGAEETVVVPAKPGQADEPVGTQPPACRVGPRAADEDRGRLCDPARRHRPGRPSAHAARAMARMDAGRSARAA